jgi:hypothetical protein
MVEDAKRGYRRVVASPKPIKIVELRTIKDLLNKGNIVIACGGGGIPVVKYRNGYKGVDAVIDKDRTRRGDFFRKPTAYWYVNCTPTYGESYQPTPPSKIKVITAGSGAVKTKKKLKHSISNDELDKMYIDHKSAEGICDEERSMISPDYARNFICDFIIGKKQRHTLPSLFED